MRNALILSELVRRVFHTRKCAVIEVPVQRPGSFWALPRLLAADPAHARHEELPRAHRADGSLREEGRRRAADRGADGVILGAVTQPTAQLGLAAQ